MSTIEPTQHPRYCMALWYAWGQQDAGVGRGVDVFEFALSHATNAVRFEQGSGVHLPSVQSAWTTFIGAFDRSRA